MQLFICLFSDANITYFHIHGCRLIKASSHFSCWPISPWPHSWTLALYQKVSNRRRLCGLSDTHRRLNQFDAMLSVYSNKSPN